MRSGPTDVNPPRIADRGLLALLFLSTVLFCSLLVPNFASAGKNVAAPEDTRLQQKPSLAAQALTPQSLTAQSLTAQALAERSQQSPVLAASLLEVSPTEAPAEARSDMLSIDARAPVASARGVAVEDAVRETAEPTTGADEEDDEPLVRGVGMCGDQAESILAPPIIYPSATATATSCAASDSGFEADREGLPSELSAKPSKRAQEVAVLLPQLSPAPRQSTKLPVTAPLIPISREAKLRLPRPPRFG